MCNAFNHSYSCSCGWGGEGHSGRRGVGNYSNDRVLPQFRTYSQILKSCTIPNAKCPVCGNYVFFYKSLSGGRVFFDELGPPWPKHPCTDSGKHVSIRDTDYLSELPTKTFSTTKGDWQPFLCLEIKKVDARKGVHEITGDLNGVTKTFFSGVIGLTDKYPFFIKESDSEVRMSTIIYQQGVLDSFEFVVKIYQSEVPNRIISVDDNPKAIKRALGDKKSEQRIKHLFSLKSKSNRNPKNQLFKKTDVPDGLLQDQLRKWLKNIKD